MLCRSLLDREPSTESGRESLGTNIYETLRSLHLDPSWEAPPSPNSSAARTPRARTDLKYRGYAELLAVHFQRLDDTDRSGRSAV
jgi:hypothetical protein